MKNNMKKELETAQLKTKVLEAINETLEITIESIIAEDNNNKVKNNELKGLLDQKISKLRNIKSQ